MDNKELQSGLKRNWQHSVGNKSAVIFLQRHFATFSYGAEHAYMYRKIRDIPEWASLENTNELDINFADIIADLVDRLNLPVEALDDIILGVVDGTDVVMIPEQYVS